MVEYTLFYALCGMTLNTTDHLIAAGLLKLLLIPFCRSIFWGKMTSGPPNVFRASLCFSLYSVS